MVVVVFLFIISLTFFFYTVVVVVVFPAPLEIDDSSTQEESATMKKLKALTVFDLTIAKTYFPTHGLIEIHLDRLIKFTSVE